MIENSVYRSILQAPKYIAAGALRGEVGASTCRARDAKTKILYAKHLLKEDRNELNRNIILKEIEQNASKWIKILFKYLKEIGITITDVQTLTKPQIIKKIKNWDTENWRKEVSEKSTLRLYFSEKKSVKEEKWIDNTEGTKLLIRGRTNSLPLGWRKRFTNGVTQCPSCSCEVETLEHFLLECPEYLNIRSQTVFLQEISGNSEEEKLKKHFSIN